MIRFARDVYQEVRGLNCVPANMQLSVEEEFASPWDLFSLLDKLKNGAEEGIRAGEGFTREEFSVAKGAIYAGKGVSLGSFTKLIGPIVLGDGVQVCDYAYLLGPLIIGDRCRIAAQATRSIILSETNAVHRDIYIGDSIVGRGCNFGAGTVTANVRFDGKPPRFVYGGQVFEPNRERLGSIIEHGVKLGINSTLKPGSYVREGQCWVGNSVLDK